MRKPHVKIEVRVERVPILRATVVIGQDGFVCTGEYIKDVPAVYTTACSLALAAHDMVLSAGLADSELLGLLSNVIAAFGVGKANVMDVPEDGLPF